MTLCGCTRNVTQSSVDPFSTRISGPNTDIFYFVNHSFVMLYEYGLEVTGEEVYFGVMMHTFKAEKNEKGDWIRDIRGNYISIADLEEYSVVQITYENGKMFDIPESCIITEAVYLGKGKEIPLESINYGHWEEGYGPMFFYPDDEQR